MFFLLFLDVLKKLGKEANLLNLLDEITDVLIGLQTKIEELRKTNLELEYNINRNYQLSITEAQEIVNQLGDDNLFCSNIRAWLKNNKNKY